jgi:hypothetical protein
MVDIAADSYRIARRHMIRLDGKDFEEKERLARCATVVGTRSENGLLPWLHMRQADDCSPTDEPRTRALLLTWIVCGVLTSRIRLPGESMLRPLRS